MLTLPSCDRCEMVLRQCVNFILLPPFNLSPCMFLDCGRSTGENSCRLGENMHLHTERPKTGLEPKTFLSGIRSSGGLIFLEGHIHHHMLASNILTVSAGIHCQWALGSCWYKTMPGFMWPEYVGSSRTVKVFMPLTGLHIHQTRIQLRTSDITYRCLQHIKIVSQTVQEWRDLRTPSTFSTRPCSDVVRSGDMCMIAETDCETSWRAMWFQFLVNLQSLPGLKIT